MTMNIGFVGCGGFGRGTHIPNVAKNPEFKIHGLCDLDEKVLAELKDKYQPEYVTTDMKRLVSDPEIQMIVCCTKPDFRLPVMRLAAEHGKALFVEKPLCYSAEEIPEMLELVEKSGIRLMVGFNRPYSPIMQDVKPLFDKHRSGNTTIIYRIIGEAGLWPFHHYDAVVNKKESTIIHEATHIFDLLNWLAGAMPTRVYTAGGGNMDNVITLDYPDNTTAVVISGDNSTAGWPKERLEINTGAGTIVGDNFVELSVAGFDEQLYYRKTYDYTLGGKIRNQPLRGMGDDHAVWRQSVTEKEKEYGYYYDRQPKVNKGHYEELEFFRKAIAEGLPIQTDARSGAAASIIAWKAIESWEKKLPIPIEYPW